MTVKTNTADSIFPYIILIQISLTGLLPRSVCFLQKLGFFSRNMFAYSFSLKLWYPLDGYHEIATAGN
jgi:hypothetical protein